MLSKEKRLNLKKDFKQVTSGKQLKTRYLKLFMRTGDLSMNSKPRIGIAVSSSIFKKATDRNRARRLTSVAFEALYTKLPSRVNIVALPKQGILSVKSKDVLLDLESVLEEANIIK